ncbi:MAG TPA: NBR1-Ig-like domain-containing protein, partial [Anaerolineales bacterium]|nr:NBR1-Ig-like domain-containing protein [Anaerolineales bacterium]
MNVPRKPANILFVIAILVFTAGCVLPFSPTPTGQPGGVITGEAQIETLDVSILESFPVQVNAALTGYLGDSCTSLGETTIAMEGNTFTITVATTRPADAVCAQVVAPFEQTVSLDVFGLPAGDYTVVAGGQTATFNLAVDNIAPEIIEPTAVPSGRIEGRVWHDLCAVAGGEGGEPAVPSVGCIETEAGGYAADGVLTPDEPGIEGVEVQLLQPDCNGAVIGTIFTNADGAYAFDNLAAGPHCVLVDPLSNPNSSILIPGGWTSANLGSAQVDLAGGQIIPALNFGWDHQFLPDPADVDPLEPTPEPGETPISNDPDCTNEMDFVRETIDDDTVIGAGADFTKTWTLENAGTCTWNTAYTLVFEDGDRMGADESYPLTENIAPGEEVTFSLDLTAPNVDGEYRGEWILRDEDGDAFGLGANDNQPFWVQIVVEGTQTDLGLGTPDWRDEFDSGANWFNLNTDNVSFVFDDGMLRMRAKIAGGGDFWGLSNRPDLQNFYIEAEFITGDACSGLDRYGLLVRAPEPNAGYVFNISCNGQFRIYEWDGDNYNQLHAWTASSAIETGPDATNVVGIWAEGDDIRLYINDILVAELDVSIYDEGRFGLLVGSTNTANFDVYVD